MSCVGIAAVELGKELRHLNLPSHAGDSSNELIKRGSAYGTNCFPLAAVAIGRNKGWAVVIAMHNSSQLLVLLSQVIIFVYNHCRLCFILVLTLFFVSVCDG